MNRLKRAWEYVKKHLRYLPLRIVWRMAVPFVIWLLAPRLLGPVEASNVRDVMMTAILVAIAAWTNHNGNRERQTRSRSIGVLDIRHEDVKGDK